MGIDEMSRNERQRTEAAKAVMAGRALHVAWVDFQRRQVSISEMAGMECLFLPPGYAGRNRFAQAWNYLRLFARTVGALRSRRPYVIWVQLPQVPLLWAALLYRALFNPAVKLVADCHNGMFRPPWSKVPMGLSLLARCDLIVVHNSDMLPAAMAAGLPAGRTLVLEDVPPWRRDAPSDSPPDIFAARPKPWVLYPGSLKSDEPVPEMLLAAEALDGGVVVLTGPQANAHKYGHDISRLPRNVVMSGFLPVEQFDALLAHADVVLALTRLEGVQLSVCNEALGFAKPMVVSDTALLRNMFGSAAVMVDSNDAQSIAQGIREAWNRRADLAQSANKLARQRRDDWLTKQWAACATSLAAGGARDRR
jgi:glycosyltransferase involved in cell wall biosynthesis